MALLKILHFPDPRLREIAKPVETIDDNLQQFIDDMFETMYDAPGIGLAATQVGVAKRIAVLDISDAKDQPMVLINPEIIQAEEAVLKDEACLSVPEFHDSVERYERVRVKAQDRQGQWFEIDANDLLAHCFQHEIDHLNGKLYIDYLSSLKRERIRIKLEKLDRKRK